MRAGKLLRGLVCAVITFAVLLVIFICVVAPKVGSFPAREQATVATLDDLLIAAKAYRRDCNRWPVIGEDGLLVFVNEGTTNWHGPYLREPWLEHPVTDSWGNDICLRSTADCFYLLSAGPDEKTNTTDDIVGCVGTNGVLTIKAGGKLAQSGRKL